MIMAAPGQTSIYQSEVMSVSNLHREILTPKAKRGRTQARPTLSLLDEDKAGTHQPHDDALVVTIQIGGYDVKRVLVDQGSGAEIMYPNLCKGLGVKPEDLDSYDSPLVGFDKKMVVLKVMVKLPIQMGSRVVEVNFIVVEAYSPYTTILARPWLHAMKATYSTLHLKVKYPSGEQFEELVGSQAVTR